MSVQSRRQLNKVLIISFIYPPLGGSGVQRTLKFSKYLPELGWQPFVVCCDDPQVFAHGLDKNLLSEIPSSVQVWRRPFVDPLSLRRRVHRLLKIPLREADSRGYASGLQPEIAEPPTSEEMQETREKGTQPQPAEERGRRSPANGLRRLLQLLSAPLSPIEFPAVDAALYWALAIVSGCLRLIRDEQIELIFSTSFPYSDHLAGYMLKKLSGLPWVADFRDPWTQNPGARNTGWRYRVDGWLEKQVLKSADRVIGVSPGYTQGLRELATGRPAEGFFTIENGYDAADMQPVSDTLKSKPLPGCSRIGHFGKVYDGTALPFLKGIEAIGEAASSLSIRFVGGLAPAEQAFLREHSQAAQIWVEPRRAHERVVEAMQMADVLLLFVLPELKRSGHIPGKMFEYLASGTPVLLIGQQGDASDLLEESGAGLFVPAGDPVAIAEALRMVAEDPAAFQKKYFHPRPEVVRRFERRALTGRLVEVFEELVSAH
ncbi:MAG: hypothetical protein A2Z16_08280 [Chloroflexi bacterium RBG_16_54_18]|nr:MAG: hypothetical protein A2Z16_08280 [Chloroflexi bacterium RBG_16_54_18]